MTQSLPRLLTVGLDEPEYRELESRLTIPILFYPDLPRIKLQDGRLFAEHPDRLDSYLAVDLVIFHGIFEDDFDLLTALALWRGPCLPSALGLLDGRLRVPCLARALSVTRYGAMDRGFAYGRQKVSSAPGAVAKWGNWHCGENKERLPEGFIVGVEPTIIEPFITGDAVRIVLVGDRAWQIKLEGADWRKSIHHPEARFMEIDKALLEDAQELAAHFGLEMVGIDYMVSDRGEYHLLEVNHVPNVTVFPEIREAFLEHATRWVEEHRRRAR